MPRFTDSRIPTTLAPAVPVAASNTSSADSGSNTAIEHAAGPERHLRCFADGLEDVGVVDG